MREYRANLYKLGETVTVYAPNSKDADAQVSAKYPKELYILQHIHAPKALKVYRKAKNGNIY